MKAVYSPNLPVSVRFSACHAAWLQARRGKKPSANQLLFEARWLDNLHQLYSSLRAGCWQPAPTVCFTVTHPKTREIHAPAFADRIVHHLLVDRLQRLYEPVFVYDSYANRTAKGSHAAVDRLQQMIRRRNGQGWYLQLDIHNYFNSIHRPTLYALLCRRLDLALQKGKLADSQRLALRSLCHKLLARKSREIERPGAAPSSVPPHKRLRNARPQCGLPVGNLTSQFFANVYLNELDQFIKHQLKVRNYLRYVDDFVLLADSKEQLRTWQAEIAAFLETRLQLRLKDAVVLAPLHHGVDFLGYRVYCGHRLVRPRVVKHCCKKLSGWWQQYGQAAQMVSTESFSKLQALLGSYWGHFCHANSVRLRHALFKRFNWLHNFFQLHADAGLVVKQPARHKLARRRNAMKIVYT
ncbi:RNA-directed DNA polymerase [Trichlorobacter lovleyi]|uniref:RNA-directed DNA polymerase (Reverse transcriptase) n=1 Tax=Trichlorobacter lovleyi (strain ATCC BAA-1151 / DSM 17278 / SZ) TaxID=398767 RepID=B3E3H0_TRIL1|nr:RNA-directed DNA polymerase [Trichlorobacter lovleyi]ACD95789.1 RNA-directed DNA polymerase (reverse transcriptase) [Trichlorobacter lovleyi SZ]